MKRDSQDRGYRGSFVFGPTDHGGDAGFRPDGARGLDEW
jgi:hypothetical protein